MPAERYETLFPIASGGMGTVSVGRVVPERPARRGSRKAAELVAIKSCHPHLRSDPKFVRRFVNEARLASRVQHENVVRTFDIIETADALSLVMDYVEGGTLAELVQKLGETDTDKRPFPLDAAVRVAVDVLRGLHAAHELRSDEGEWLRLVHRDVSPQNILVSVDGVARLVDFGIAKAATLDGVTTTEGKFHGKLGYMAIEQLSGGDVSRRSDLYALGIVLWELVAGRRLFQVSSPLEMLNVVRYTPLPRLADLRADVHPELDAVLARATARDPCDRFPTAAAMADALDALGVTGSREQVAGLVQELLADRIAGRQSRIDAALAEKEPHRRVPRGALFTAGLGALSIAAVVGAFAATRGSPPPGGPIPAAPAAGSAPPEGPGQGSAPVREAPVPAAASAAVDAHPHGSPAPAPHAHPPRARPGAPAAPKRPAAGTSAYLPEKL